MRAPPALLLALLAALTGAPPGRAQEPRWVGVPEARVPGEADRERFARHSLENGRALRREGRLEVAEQVLRRALAQLPEDPALHRELARLLEEMDRTEDAARQRAAADALDPPPVPLPRSALGVASRGIAVALLAPPAAAEPSRRPRGWPRGAVAETLEERLRVRLPEAAVSHAAPETVDEAREWLRHRRARVALTLRVDRIYCGDSIKDGRFGLAWLRAAADRPDAPGTEPIWRRTVLEEPQPPQGCETEVAARALEQVLALPSIREALAAPSSGGAGGWSTASLRALFPGLGERIDAELAAGQDQLARGHVGDAAEAFRRALRVDPEDTVALTYLGEAEATLRFSRELSRRRGRNDAGVLEPRLNLAQREALETRLDEEQRRRDELLAALAVLEESERLPEAPLLANLRPVEIRDPAAFGPALARQRAGGEVHARAALAPNGDAIAVYYFPHGASLPVLREEDTDGDGRIDRWIAYAGDARSETWEAVGGAALPEAHLVFGAGGDPLLRVEIDRDRDGRIERTLRYSGGALTSEARDTDGDGRLDTFDRFDSEGRLRIREQDRNGDGEIDMRSVYEAGRLVRRELSSPDDT
jgi:Flp pilus assembly protein TadD